MTYNPDAKTFTLPPEQALALAVEGSPCFVAGGFDVDNLSTTELYDPRSGTWSFGAPMARRRRLKWRSGAVPP